MTDLLSNTPHTGVTDDADREPSRETGEADTEPGAEHDEARVERHRGLELARDEHRHDQAVDLRVGTQRRSATARTRAERRWAGAGARGAEGRD